MSSNNGCDNAQHSAPIPINTRGRSRSASMSSGYSSGGSPSSPSLPATPMTGSMSSPKIGVQGGSPIMSYFLAQSPTKPAATFPFRRFGATPVFEGEWRHNNMTCLRSLTRSQKKKAIRSRLRRRMPAVPAPSSPVVLVPRR